MHVKGLIETRQRQPSEVRDICFLTIILTCVYQHINLLVCVHARSNLQASGLLEGAHTLTSGYYRLTAQKVNQDFA